MAHAKDLRRLGHFAPSHLGKPEDCNILLGKGVKDVAALAARARDHHDLDTLGNILRTRRPALARLIVGMGVDSHEAEGEVHVHSLAKRQWAHAKPLPKGPTLPRDGPTVRA